jgi:hypothetical protein
MTCKMVLIHIPIGARSMCLIASSLSVLQHLQEKIEGVWQVFFADDPALLPREIAHKQLEQATEALDQQIRRALVLTFGSDSLPLHQFCAVGFLPVSATSMMNAQLLLDSIIFDLEQKRLSLLRWSASSLTPQVGWDSKLASLLDELRREADSPSAR